MEDNLKRTLATGTQSLNRYNSISRAMETVAQRSALISTSCSVQQCSWGAGPRHAGCMCDAPDCTARTCETSGRHQDWAPSFVVRRGSNALKCKLLIVILSCGKIYED